MKSRYGLSGVCARTVDLSINPDGTIESVEFVGGCNGNLKAISKLVKGKQAQEIAEILKGNRCGMRDSSCADGLAGALQAELQRMRENGELAEA